MSLPENAVIFVDVLSTWESSNSSWPSMMAPPCEPSISGRSCAKSRHPLIRAYLDPTAFSRFTVREGDLMWGDYDLCFPVADLYEGLV